MHKNKLIINKTIRLYFRKACSWCWWCFGVGDGVGDGSYGDSVGDGINVNDGISVDDGIGVGDDDDDRSYGDT